MVLCYVTLLLLFITLCSKQFSNCVKRFLKWDVLCIVITFRFHRRVIVGPKVCLCNIFLCRISLRYFFCSSSYSVKWCVFLVFCLGSFLSILLFPSFLQPAYLIFPALRLVYLLSVLYTPFYYTSRKVHQKETTCRRFRINELLYEQITILRRNCCLPPNVFPLSFYFSFFIRKSDFSHSSMFEYCVQEPQEICIVKLSTELMWHTGNGSTYYIGALTQQTDLCVLQNTFCIYYL